MEDGVGWGFGYKNRLVVDGLNGHHCLRDYRYEDGGWGVFVRDGNGEP